jgi:hypothetical protein
MLVIALDFARFGHKKMQNVLAALDGQIFLCPNLTKDMVRTGGIVFSRRPW